MARSLAMFVGLSFLGSAFVLATCIMVYRLTPEHRRREGWRWLLSWFVKGLVLPVLLWTVMNLGVSWSLQPFMPEIQAAQIANDPRDPWFPIFLGAVGTGIFIAGSYWSALGLGWVLLRVSRGLEGEQRSDFKGLCMTCSMALGIPAIGIFWLGGLPVAGMAAAVVLAPIAGYAPNIIRLVKLPPMYSRAVARIKFGKYSEAEIEIIRQLENAEDDFDGWMMLAELYAKNFKDLSEAEKTVLEVCDHAKTNPTQLSIALHRLADWHLELADDPETARRTLQVICDRLPGTHLGMMAQLRMKQLPLTSEELREQRSARPIPLPVTDDGAFPAELGAVSNQDRYEAAHLANACVQRLERDPNDVAAREKLAHLLVERLGKVDQGLEQLILLLNMPNQPDVKRAEWLNLEASWHLNCRQDAATAKNIFERLIHEFPSSPQAAAARRRILAGDVE